jgi:hypothetical protein
VFGSVPVPMKIPPEPPATNVRAAEQAAVTTTVFTRDGSKTRGR